MLRSTLKAVATPTFQLAKRGVQIEARLAQRGIQLSDPVPPKGNYVPAVRSGNTLFLAGHIPLMPDNNLAKGKVGKDVTPEQANAIARQVAINILSTLKVELGDLDRVTRIVKLVGFVNCTDDFTGQPGVINGASDLFVEVFGKKGVHARSAVGTNALPLGIPVEIEAVIEFSEDE
ncbi:putative translation initiation inhibitor [Tribonema minus]|uniref:Putative translation initiation inhibitor n=1 Tax=Tribonema minus TaxID=303371 RepID=A0A835Z1E3_9STRA|nr:putative translation initiation inhibitor [Tribonema minus]